MKKSQVNAILVEQTKRKNTIIKYSIVIFVSFLVSLLFLILFINRNKNYTVSYKENSNINYKVYLKKNPYFNDDYLGRNNEYLEQLIDYISADFKYDISTDEKDVDFKYSYKIDAEVELRTKDGSNPIYSFKDSLVTSPLVTSNSKNKISIDENLNVDFNHYNNIIKNFISSYGLNSIDATLKIKMNVKVLGSCEDFENDSDSESSMSLVIPLNSKTVKLSIENDNNPNDNVMVCKKNNLITYIYFSIFVLFTFSLIYFAIILVKYIISTRTPEDIYHKELAKILNNYGSYIQEVTGDANFKGYSLWKIKSFNDMLEISDRINEPILMVENLQKNGVFFAIPTSDKRVYIYTIKVSTIKKQMEENILNKDGEESNN